MIQKKKDIIKSLSIHDKDVGSAEVQIGLLTNKITKLAGHFKVAKKDKHSTMGLTKSVNRRKKLLAYLKRTNHDSYTKVLKQLNLRK
jgi:small subunit ribosomal protein S15